MIVSQRQFYKKERRQIERLIAHFLCELDFVRIPNSLRLIEIQCDCVRLSTLGLISFHFRPHASKKESDETRELR